MSDVYFIKVGAKKNADNLISKIARLYDHTGYGDMISENDLTAVKVHFGEPGNTTFLRPIYVRPIIDKILAGGGKPFLTDANTLYVGGRANAVDHLNTAILHGWLPSVVNAPVLIADGMTGRDFVEVEIGLKNCKTVKYGSAVHHADALIAVSHFKGHLAAGMGGTLKNIGMGLGSRAGKQIMHSDIKPDVKDDKCIGCGTCIKWCPEDAITISAGKAIIDHDKCIGCAECVISCPTKAISIRWDATNNSLQEKIAEYTYGVLKGKKNKAFFFNFVMNVTPDCDCLSWSDVPIVPDIGILASKDPVAIDMASGDMVNQQRAIAGSRITKNIEPGQDKIYEVHEIDWKHQLKYGEEIGLGSTKYNIIEIE